MASTKKKRQTKHRGNAAGFVETRGRTGRNRPVAETPTKRSALRTERFNPPPSWKGPAQRAAIARHAKIAEAELVGLAPAAAFEGFPGDIHVRNRRTIEEAVGSR